MQQGFWHGALCATDRTTAMSGKSCVVQFVRVALRRVESALCSRHSSSEELGAYQTARGLFQPGGKLHTLAYYCHPELGGHS